MRNFRICRLQIDFFDKAFDKYRCDGSLSRMSHQDLVKARSKEGSVYSDDFSREMRALGNESIELFPVLEMMQKRWADENEVSYTQNRWPLQILEAQLNLIRPDVVYIQGVNAVPWLVYHPLRERLPFIKLMVGYAGAACDAAQVAPLDLVISGIPGIRDNLRQGGIDSEVVYHGFAPRILDQLRQQEAAKGPGDPISTSFIGTTGAGIGATHRKRYISLLYMMYASDMIAWTNEGDADNLDKLPELLPDTPDNRLRLDKARLWAGLGASPAEQLERLVDQVTRITGSQEPQMLVRDLFPERCRPAIFGIDMYDVLHRSAMTFNIHGDFVYGNIGNMRMFEATGVGTCMLTDVGSNMKDLFEADTEVVTYTSLAELGEKVRWLHDHPAERQAIASAGQRRTLAEHTVAHRCRQIHELIAKAL